MEENDTVFCDVLCSLPLYSGHVYCSHMIIKNTCRSNES